MNTYAVLTNAVNNKTTRVLVRNGTINSRQCNDAINRISSGMDGFHLKSDIPVTVLDTVPSLRITNKGMRWTDTNHIIQNSEKRYTVVYNLEYDASGNVNALKYAVARTAPRDNFSRKLGRTIATGRLNSGKATNVVRIPLNGKVPTTGKEWQALENGLKTIVERDFNRKG